MNASSEWDWVARPEHYVSRKISDKVTIHGIHFPYAEWETGPPGWPCIAAEGGTASPGTTWLVCNRCGEHFGEVQRGGDGYAIDRQNANRIAAVNFHSQHCGRDSCKSST